MQVHHPCVPGKTSAPFEHWTEYLVPPIVALHSQVPFHPKSLQPTPAGMAAPDDSPGGGGGWPMTGPLASEKHSAPTSATLAQQTAGASFVQAPGHAKSHEVTPGFWVAFDPLPGPPQP